MPRIATPTKPQVVDARSRLKAYLKHEGLTVNAYAHRVDVPQPTLHRFLAGRTKSITPLISKALTYARIEPDSGITEKYDVADHPKLRRALRVACDGRTESVELLASLIEALAPVLAAHRTVK